MATKIYLVEDDQDRDVVFDLVLDGEGMDLTGLSVVCHMKDVRSGDLTTITNVTADPDQTTYPGRCTTRFSASNLADPGSYHLEWTVDPMITFPGNYDDLPLLIVRQELG
jgi:hypothetical protein